MSVFDTYRTRAYAPRKVIGHTLGAVDTPEVILSPPEGHKLALVYVIAWQDATGTVDVKLRDTAGNGALLSESIERDRGHPLIQSSVGLIIDGDLEAEVSDVAVLLSAWAFDVE